MRSNRMIDWRRDIASAEIVSSAGAPNQLEENTKFLIDEVKKLKPASAKGVYIKNVSLSIIMGLGIKLDISNIL